MINLKKSRKLSDRFLFNPVGIEDNNGVKIASADRAAADLLYFNSKTYFDNSKKINWKKVKKIQKEIGYPLTPKYYDIAKSKRRKT